MKHTNSNGSLFDNSDSSPTDPVEDRNLCLKVLCKVDQFISSSLVDTEDPLNVPEMLYKGEN